MDKSQIQVYVEPGSEYAGEVGASLTEQFADRVRELGQGLGEIANDLRAQLDATLREDDRTSWGLEEVQLSFSLDLQAAAGIVVAKASTAAGFEATMTWRRRSQQD
jgi:hypothetical protein